MGLSSLLHLVSCWSLIGVIWIIQLVHYPAYRFIDASQFTQYQLFHSNQITYFVAPMMLMEFASSVWMLYQAFQTRTNLTWQIVSFVLLLIIWGLTFFKIVPLHSQLQFGKDSSMIEQIIQLNWWRTILWSARGLLILKLIWKF